MRPSKNENEYVQSAAGVDWNIRVAEGNPDVNEVYCTDCGTTFYSWTHRGPAGQRTDAVYEDFVDARIKHWRIQEHKDRVLLRKLGGD